MYITQLRNTISKCDVLRANLAESSLNPLRAMKPIGAAFDGHSKRARQSGFSTVAAASASYACFSSNLDRFDALFAMPYKPFLHTAAK
jgi:hypothetical protein